MKEKKAMSIGKICKGVYLVLCIQNLVDRAPSDAERMKLKTRLQKILFFKDSSESPYEKKIQPMLVCHPLEENLSSASNSGPQPVGLIILLAYGKFRDAYELPQLIGTNAWMV